MVEMATVICEQGKEGERTKGASRPRLDTASCEEGEKKMNSNKDDMICRCHDQDCPRSALNGEKGQETTKTICHCDLSGEKGQRQYATVTLETPAAICEGENKHEASYSHELTLSLHD
eukprot:g498.t1